MIPIVMPPHLPLCLLYSTAMILDEKPETLMAEIGHDGLAIFWEGDEVGDGSNVDAVRIRNFSIEEMQDCCFRRNKALVKVDPNPHLNHADTQPRPIWEVNYAWKRFCAIMTKYSGLIHTDSHCMAQHRGIVYNTTGNFFALNPKNPGQSGIIGGWILVTTKP